MKKIILTIAAVFAFGVASAQDMKYGVKAGVDFASSQVKVGGASANGSETGFYLGGFVDFSISEKFHVQPELLYVTIKDLDQVQIPILAKYMATEKLAIVAGPNLGFLTNAADGIKSFNYGLDFGGSYDVTENISIDAKYNLGLANLLDGGDSDNSIKLSGIFVGASYKF